MSSPQGNKIKYIYNWEYKNIIVFVKVLTDVLREANMLQGAPWSWKVMEFRKTIFQAWKVMENSKGHGKSWKMMIMSCNFYYCTERFCKSDKTSFIRLDALA